MSSQRPEASLPAQSLAEAHLAVRELLESPLQQVEVLFRESLASPLSLVAEIGQFVAEGGGKRIRPMLHLLCARLCGYDGPHDVVLATVLEMIHSATLVHDDVIDGSELRRGRPAVHARWGNPVTVLFGDYLFAKAMELALRAGSLEVMRTLARITLRMTEGEMLQTRYKGRLDLTEAEHLDLVERKTAELFGGCCELAGLLAGVDMARREQLRRYGLKLGMAFQLVDDLLDLTGDRRKLGKPTASDLREGKVTLAVIDLLRQDPGTAMPLVRRLMEGEGESGEALALLLQRSGALERTRARARRFAIEARQALDGFGDGPARRALELIPDILVARDH